jgi:hypothetical protein
MATEITEPEKVLETSTTRPSRRLARWAWVWVGLTPVGWAGTLAIFAAYETSTSDIPWYLRLLIVLLLLIPPPTALAFAFLARRDDRDAAKVVFVVAAVLVECAVFGVLGGVLGQTWGIAAAVAAPVLILLAVYVWPGLTRPSRRRD